MEYRNELPSATRLLTIPALRRRNFAASEVLLWVVFLAPIHSALGIELPPPLAADIFQLGPQFPVVIPRGPTYTLLSQSYTAYNSTGTLENVLYMAGVLEQQFPFVIGKDLSGSTQMFYEIPDGSPSNSGWYVVNQISLGVVLQRSSLAVPGGRHDLSWYRGDNHLSTDDREGGVLLETIDLEMSGLHASQFNITSLARDQLESGADSFGVIVEPRSDPPTCADCLNPADANANISFTVNSSFYSPLSLPPADVPTNYTWSGGDGDFSEPSNWVVGSPSAPSTIPPGHNDLVNVSGTPQNIIYIDEDTSINVLNVNIGQVSIVHKFDPFVEFSVRQLNVVGPETELTLGSVFDELGREGWGSLNVLNGARLETGAMTLGDGFGVPNPGSFVARVAGPGSRWNASVISVQLGTNGVVGRLTVEDAGSVEIDGDLLIGDGFDSTGHLEVKGAGSTVVVSGVVGNLALHQGGSIEVTGGALLWNYQYAEIGGFGGAGPDTHVLVSGADSYWRSDRPLNTPSHIRVLSGGCLNCAASVLEVSSGGVVETDTVFAEGNNTTIQLNQGLLSAAVEISRFSRLLGSGEIMGALMNDANLGVGDQNQAEQASLPPIREVGSLLVGGDFVQTVNGQLTVDVGDFAGDQFLVQGSAYLHGELRIAFDPYPAVPGSTYEILSATGGINGTFDEIFYPELPEGLTWQIDYSSGDRVLVGIVVDNMGDANGDGMVDAQDYDEWKLAFGNTGFNLPSDFNHDGTVNAADYTIWRDHLGQIPDGGSFTSSSLPEPSTFVLLILAAAGALLRRHGPCASSKLVGE
jgi:hypothetical protein